MADTTLRGALERRYDGPIPAHASVPADYDQPWPVQAANRRRSAWQEVRRRGRLALRARAAYRAAGSADRERDWRRRRTNLAFALRSWAYWRGGRPD